MDHIVPFGYFCEWYKQTNARTLSRNSEINKDELQESFIKYRDDLLSRTAKGFVKEHMTEEWFKEKYDRVLGPATLSKLVNYRKWLYEMFMQDMDAGKFDELTLDGAAGGSSEMLVNSSPSILCREKRKGTKSTKRRRGRKHRHTGQNASRPNGRKTNSLYQDNQHYRLTHPTRRCTPLPYQS